MPKRRRSKAFWKNFKFKYKLTIVNENTLEEKELFAIRYVLDEDSKGTVYVYTKDSIEAYAIRKQ